MLAAPLFESAIHTFRPWLHLDDEHVRGCIVSGTNRLHRKGRATGQSDEGYSNQLLQGVVKEPEQFYIIHDSSQLLYDDDSEGHSPASRRSQ